jgi:hypothetical protein
VAQLGALLLVRLAGHGVLGYLALEDGLPAPQRLPLALKRAALRIARVSLSAVSRTRSMALA